MAADRYRLALGISLLGQYCGHGKRFFQCGIDVDLSEVVNFHLTSLLEYLWQKGRQLLVDVFDVTQKLLHLSVTRAKSHDTASVVTDEKNTEIMPTLG